jgi:orotate phosphoribosyltransferase
MHPDGLSLIGPLALEMLEASNWGGSVTAVGGLTLGADPVSYAISYASALARGAASASGPGIAGSAAAATRAPLRAFTVRKEAKTHGTGKLVEGPFEPGDHVAIIEDVITTGGSAQRAIEAVRGAGGVIAGVLALVDREEGGREAIEAAGLPVLALVRRRDIDARTEQGDPSRT